METVTLNSINQLFKANIDSGSIKDFASTRLKSSYSELIKKNTSTSFFDEKNIDEIANNINKFLSSLQTELKVEIHSKTRTPIFKIVRKYDNKVIQEVPPSKLLDLKASFEKIAGVFLSIFA